MDNLVKLSDDELCTVVVALQTTLAESARYIQQHGAESLDAETKIAIKGTAKLYGRIKKEYF